eukprot:scaffold609_cov170-Amphora_coffeaeformis.AAC.23
MIIGESTADENEAWWRCDEKDPETAIKEIERRPSRWGVCIGDPLAGRACTLSYMRMLARKYDPIHTTPVTVKGRRTDKRLLKL